MSFFRIHIIKITLIILCGVGLTMLAWPWQSGAPNGESVSNWLFELRTESENAELHDKITSLRTESGDVPWLLRKASDIIRDHSDDFAIPVDSDSATDDEIYNTLLIKWSLHKHGGATADSVTIKERQTTSLPNNPEKEDRAGLTKLYDTVRFVIGVYGRVNDVVDHLRRFLRPLSSGIAINAP